MNLNEREYILTKFNRSTDPSIVGLRGTVRLITEREISSEELGLGSPWEVESPQKIRHRETGVPYTFSNLTISSVSLRRPLTQEEQEKEIESQ